MPQIPRYPRADTISQADTGNASYPTIEQRQVQLGGNDIIAAPAKALNVASQVEFAAAARAQEKEDADVTFRAEAGLKDGLAKVLRAEQDKQGIDAWGSSERVSQWFGEAEKQYAEGLTSDAQRRVFSRTFANLRLQAIDSASRHEVAQRNKSLTESTEATIAGSINFAAANYTNPQAIDTAKDDITRRGKALGALRGWTAEQHERFVADKISTMHLQVLENLVTANPSGANAYYQLNQGEIDGTKRNTVERVIKEGTLRTRIQGIVDEVTATGATEAQGIERIRKEFSGDEEDRAVTALKMRFKEASDARERAQRDAADAAYNIFARTGRLDAIPPALLEKLDGKVLIALRKDAKHLSEGSAAKTDPNLYYELRDLAARDPDKFRNLDLRQFFPRLGKGDRETMIDLQMNLEKPEKQRDLRTLSQQLDGAYRSMGWKGSDGEKKGVFEQRVLEALRTEQMRNGNKPLNDEQRQKIIDKMMLQGEVLSGRWYMNDPNKRFYEVAGTADVARFSPFVPKAERDQIVAAFAKRGKAKPTEKEIVDLYRQRHGL